MVDEEIGAGIVGWEQTRNALPLAATNVAAFGDEIRISHPLGVCLQRAMFLPGVAVFRVERNTFMVSFALGRKEAKFHLNILPPFGSVFYGKV